METVSVLSTLQTWAKNAYSLLTGGAGLGLDALAGLWHYATAIYNAVAWVIGGPLLGVVTGLLNHESVLHHVLQEIRDALHRLAGWIWLTQVQPVQHTLQTEITALRAWATARFTAVEARMLQLYQQALAYTRTIVAIERVQRTEADAKEHAEMTAAVTAALATVQHQATAGYNAARHDRFGLIGQLLGSLKIDDAVAKVIVDDLINAVIDYETIESPILRTVIQKAVDELVAKLGVDKVIGDLLAGLLGDIIGNAKPAGLQDVTHDISGRLNDLEKQWAEFMADGGPEVEQAGKEWKSLSSLAVDVGILGMFGLAVADPQAWSTTVADAIGKPADAVLKSVFGLISHV